MDAQEIVSRFQNVRQSSQHEWMASCPAHDDSNASLHLTEMQDGALLMKCFAGCSQDDILQAVGLTWKDLPQKAFRPSVKYGLTLAEYAEAKCISVARLMEFGLQDAMRVANSGKSYPGVVMPYFDERHANPKLRWRMRMAKETGKQPSRFLWDKDGHMRLYGLWRLMPPEQSPQLLLVEGESDCHALWNSGFPALGFPGAANYRPDRDDDVLRRYPNLYVHIEKDSGGEKLFTSFAGSPAEDGFHFGGRPSVLLPQCRFFSLKQYKDPSEAWQALHDRPEEFVRLIQDALADAKPAGQFEWPESWRRPEPPAPETQPSAVPLDHAADNAAKRTAAEASAENGKAGGRRPTDYAGLTEAYFKLHSQNGVCTVRQWRKGWYVFDGHCYRRYEQDEYEKMVMAWLQDPLVSLEYHYQPTANVCRNLLANLASTRYCGITGQDVTVPWWLEDNASAAGWMAVNNCLINVEYAAVNHLAAARENGGYIDDGQVAAYTRPLTPGLLTTFALPYDYDPKADCPKFKRWLATTIPDPQVQSALLMMMGLCLVPDTSYNVCFFLAGEGGTGKSTFQAILEALVGSANVCSVALLDFEDKFKQWKLAEHLVNIVGEMPTDDPQGRLRYLEGFFKDSVSGGNVNYEKKHENSCEAKAIARHVFATNSLPIFFDKSEGIWDRLIIIPFEQRFRNSSAEIRDIKTEIIADEMPGILNLALTGLAQLRQHTRFPEPDKCKAVKLEHRNRCDFDNLYLNDYYVPREGAEIVFSKAYEHYNTVLMKNGLRGRSAPTFEAAISRVYGLKVTRRSRIDRTRVVKGLACNYYEDLDTPVNGNDAI